MYWHLYNCVENIDSPREPAWRRPITRERAYGFTKTTTKTTQTLIPHTPM